MIRFVKKMAVAVAAILLGVAAASAFAYIELFGTIKGLVTVAGAQHGILTPDLVRLVGGVVALLTTGPLLVMFAKALIGKFPTKEVVALSIAAGICGGAYIFYTADWLFDSSGKPLWFVCRSAVPGDLPRLQRTEVDHLLGGKCISIDRETAPVVLALRRGFEPKAINLTTTTELDNLKLFDRGAPVVFVGASITPDGPPRLFSGPGFDDRSPGLLAPATKDALKSVRTMLAAAEETARARAAREAELQAQADATREVEERRSAAQKQREAELEEQRKVAERADELRRAAQERREAERERAADAARAAAEAERIEQQRRKEAEREEQNRVAYLKFFTQDLPGGAPLIVIYGAGGRYDRKVAAYLSNGPWWSTNVLQQNFYDTLQLAEAVRNQYCEGLAQIKYPPSLQTMILAEVDEFYIKRTDGSGWTTNVPMIRVRTAKFDIRAWTVSYHQFDMQL